MSIHHTWAVEIAPIHEELVFERIRSLHREAEEQRLVHRIQRLNKARRRAERASARLRQVLDHMV